MDDGAWLKWAIGGVGGLGAAGFWRLWDRINFVEASGVKRNRVDVSEINGKIAALHERINGSASKDDVQHLEDRLTAQHTLIRDDVRGYRSEASEQLNRIMDKLDRLDGKK